MFACKNCGGNIRYDIKSKKLVCGICSSSFEPESIQKENDSVDYDYFETTVFTCPQCGAKIMCEDNEAASFCTYCSSSTVLTSRVTKEKKPDYIIPFAKTKEECIGEFKNITKKAVFAPKELRDDKVLNNFKAIYMPYWYYNVKQENEEFCVNAMEDLGDATLSAYNYYDVKGSVKAELDGVCKDASYKFSDDLSERISPFFMNEKKDFYPSYLSGFYADISDVPPEIYVPEMEKEANERTRDALSKKVTKESDTKIKVYLSDEEANKQFKTNVTAKRVLLPVWFMSFKEKKKVAYMTVNGQTGMAASDLPISIKKYIIATLLLTLLLIAPAALILFLFSEHVAAAALDIVLILSIPAFLVYYFNIKQMQLLDTDSEDVAKFYKKYGVVYIKGDRTQTTIKNFYECYLKHEIITGLFAAAAGAYFILTTVKLIFSPETIDSCFKIVLTFFNLILALIGLIRALKLQNSSKYFGIIVAMVGQLVVMISMFLTFGHNGIVTGYVTIIDAALVSVGCFFMFLDLVKYHNEVVMRKPPHLERRGGDDIADSLNVGM